jgi:hypothetical protein
MALGRFHAAVIGSAMLEGQTLAICPKIGQG